MATRTLGTIAELCNTLNVPTDSIPPNIQGLLVRINPRLRTAFGRARFSGGDLRPLDLELNSAVASGADAVLRDTFAHEVAHLIAGHSAGHNAMWARTARTLGCTGNQYASKAEAAAVGIERRTKVVGVCEGCGVEIRRTRRLAPGRTYRHSGSGCGARILRPYEVR